MVENDDATSVLFVDDQASAVSGVRDFLESQGGYEFVSSATLEEAKSILKNQDIDVVLLDLAFGKNYDIEKTIDFMQWILDSKPTTKVIIYSTIVLLNKDIVREVLIAGASYLVKESVNSSSELDHAIQLVLSGSIVYSDSLASFIKQLHTETRQSELTEKEFEVAQLVHQGKTNGQIGSELGISEATARDRVVAIMRKLDVDSRTLVATWFERNYPDLAE